MLNAISSDSLLRVTHFSDVKGKLFVDNEENVGVIAVGRKLRNFAVLALKMTEWPACRSRVDEKFSDEGSTSSSSILFFHVSKFLLEMPS